MLVPHTINNSISAGESQRYRSDLISYPDHMCERGLHEYETKLWLCRVVFYATTLLSIIMYTD